jgi:hypothetical protein
MFHETPFPDFQTHYFAFGEALSITKYGVVSEFKFGLVGGRL